MENRSAVGNGAAGVWRAVDAAANRAAEALRVVEDVARFVIDDARSTALARDLRHELAAILAGESLRLRVALRDVAGDVGAGMRSEHALHRGSAADLVAANAARAAQALRSLEECAAVVAPDAAPRFERLRYRVYELERGGLAVARARERLAGIDLCVLVDGRRDGADFTRLVGALVEAGVRILQIRATGLGVPALVDRVRRALEIVRSRDGEDRALVVVNDRADVAAALGASGVHTGADDLATALVRRVVGPAALVGRTAHDVAEARAAVAEGADYLGVGPCFPSATKSFSTHAPPEFLRTVAAEVALPVYAIGGVTLERLDALAALGIHRVAVASAVTAAADPAAAAAALLARLGNLR
ncbi:MAG: thiamine phosphate synthase [Planctomycetaceae bacterium]